MSKNSKFIICGTMAALAAAVLFTPKAGIVYADEEVYVQINEKNFVDPVFREYVKQFDKDNDNMLSTTERNAVTKIDVYNSGVKDICGLQYFEKVRTLYVSKNPIKTLDLSDCPQIETLHCENCELTSINLTGLTKLSRLDCYSNSLTTIDLSTNTALWYLDVSNNNLTSLNVTKNTKLSQLHISDNELTSLNLSKCTNLWQLWFSAKEKSNNKLTSIDLSKCTNLSDVVLGYHNLTSLDVSKNTKLTRLVCYYANLTELDISNNTELTELVCSNNQIKSLTVTQCTKLEELDCSSNKISALNVTKCTLLKKLYCNDNALKSLNITQCTKLERFVCDNNQITSLDPTKCTSLLVLSCENNSLEALDATKCTKLYKLACGGNKIAALDVSNCTLLEYLHCYSNELKTLDVTNQGVLRELYCYDNSLTSLKLAGASQLRHLFCQANKLTALDVTKNTNLYMLACYGNSIKTLNLNSTPDLNACMCRFYGKLQYTIRGKTYDALNYQLSNYNYVIVDPSTKVVSSYLTPTPTPSNTPTPSPTPKRVVKIDEEHFPDDRFREMVLTYSDSNFDGYLDVNDVARTTWMSVSRGNLTSLKGIEYFTELTILDCSWNAFASLDVSKNIKLVTLDAGHNKLTKLDVSKNTELKSLNCESNNLTSLNVLANTSLESLNCSGNQLTSLNLSKNPLLKELICYGNNISSLKIYFCPKLVTAYTKGEKTVDPNYIKYVTKELEEDYSLIIPSATKVTSLIPKPAGVNAESASATSVKVSWNAVTDATGYQVWRSTSSSGTYTSLGTVTTNSKVSTSLTTGKTYYYKVRAYIEVNGTKYYGAYSSVVSAVPKVAAPTGVKAVSASATSIKVSWSAVSGATGYQVWRATSSTGTYTSIGTVTTTSKESVGLTTGKTYYYKVRAYKEVNGTKKYGDYSVVVSAAPKPSAPSEVKAVSASSTSIKVSWNAVSGATGYEVYRCTTADGTYSKLGYVTTTSRTCGSLTTGKNYYFKVRAYTEVNGTKVYSGYSTVVSAAPKT